MRSDARKNYEHLFEMGRAVVAEQGVNASMREVARRAGVGIGTLYRHFPTREALLEALLRDGFDQLAATAGAPAIAGAAGSVLVTWLRAMVALAHSHRGVISAMTAAMEDPGSSLHASCVALRAAGAQLLARAQAEGAVRPDIDGVDLLALVSALAWLNDQAPFASRVDRLFDMVTHAILVTGGEDTAVPASS